MIGTDRDLMFDVRAQIIEELQNDHASALRQLTSICPSHHDYMWSWLEHDLGGRIGRALVIDGADHKTILNMRDAITSELQSQPSDAFTEFSEICGGHTDYLWAILISHPEM